MADKKELNLEEAEKVSGGTFKTAEEVMAAVDKIKMGTGKTSTPATPAQPAPAPATPDNPGDGGSTNTNTNSGHQIHQQGEGNQLANNGGGNITVS